jgi:hypothetical protein
LEQCQSTIARVHPEHIDTLCLALLGTARRSSRKFCRPLAFYNPGSVYEISIVGSCFLVKHVQRLVLVTTSHQLGKSGSSRETQ